MANARVGQKNKITRRWAKRGTRPSAPHDQRTILSYDFIGSHGIGEPLPATPFMAGSDGGRIGAFWVVWTAFE